MRPDKVVECKMSVIRPFASLGPFPSLPCRVAQGAHGSHPPSRLRHKGSVQCTNMHRLLGRTAGSVLEPSPKDSCAPKTSFLSLSSGSCTHRSLVIVFRTTRTGLLSNELTAWKLVLTTNRGHRMSRLEHTPLAVPGPAAYQFGCCRILSGFQKLLCVASAQPDYLVQVWGNQPLLKAKKAAGGKRHGSRRSSEDLSKFYNRDLGRGVTNR
jgi:hypothetical protein